MDDPDDTFKVMVHYGEDESAPENLDADGLVDFDRQVVTNEYPPSSVNKVVKEYLSQPAETVQDGSSDGDEVPTNPNHHHHKMKSTRQLKS